MPAYGVRQNISVAGKRRMAGRSFLFTNWIFVSLLASGLVLLLHGICISDQGEPEPQAGAASALPFAMVELFTSEG